MNEQETISKVLTGETDIAKMSHDDFVEMLKCLGRMYFSRVMNCVDVTGKSDKEWTALSFIFSRVVEAITEKPSGNSAAMREALEATLDLFWDIHNANRSPQSNQAYAVIKQIKAALAAPPRNCDVGTAAEQEKRYNEWLNADVGRAVLGLDPLEWEYVQPVYPGHGACSVAIAEELGIRFHKDEIVAITYHMGAFGIGKEYTDKEFYAAMERFAPQIIATCCADWWAASVDERGGAK